MNIAVICAFPASSNPGMLSVDLAVESLRQGLPSNTNIDRFCAWRGFDKQGVIPLHYRHYHSISQLESYDRVIFWGDFLHWRSYGLKDFLTRGRGKIENFHDQDIIDHWYSLYLFENHQELQNKTLIFGGTFYAMTHEDVSDCRYMQALASLYSNAKLSLMRDLVSANYVAQITGNNRSNFGCDCAALLEVAHVFPDTSVSHPYVAYALGRSGHSKEVKNFLHLVCDQMGHQAIDLNWLDKGAGVDSTIEKIATINRAQAVVTDIYHCAITAWRESTPVLCIGQGANRVHSTLSDKKKELLHTQIFSIENYIYLEEILQPNQSRLVTHCADVLARTSKDNVGSRTLRCHANQSLHQLLTALQT